MSAQTSLDFRRTEQAAQLARVSANLGDRIVEFCRARVGQTFRAAELHAACAGSAPASADRVLRALRREGRIGYVVESRSGSLYRVEFVR